MKNKLKEIRRQRGLSQIRLSLLTNIAPSEISRIECGWLKPYPGWRFRLARALDVPESELFPTEVKNGEDD